ncbi:unnamed protein product [Coregonus sp. 'balchen']|nr:unnamed protein product [Coregonus sp. 'balchen']
MASERSSYPVKIVLNKQRSSSQWREGEMTVEEDSQPQPTDVEQRVETEPILIKDEETAEDVWKTDHQEELRVTGEESGSKPGKPPSFEQRHCNEDFITQPNISLEDSVEHYPNSDHPEEPGTPRLASTEVFSTEQHQPDKDSLELVMVKDEKEEELDQTTALAGPDQFVMDETDGQLWTSVDPGRDADPDGHPDFSFHSTEEYSQNISIFPSHSGLPSVPNMTDDVGPSLHSSIWKPHANMFSAGSHMKRHVRTLADETRQQMSDGESSERLNLNNEGNSLALQPMQHQYRASESTVRMSECMTGSNMATTSTFSGYSLSRSSFNMEQFVSIMEVLAKAAVAEINNRVDDSCAVIRLEITQSQRDIDVLKRKCQMMESELKKTRRRKGFYPMASERTSYPVKIVSNKQRSTSQWRDREMAVEGDSQPQPTDVEQRVETEPILIKDEETAEDVWKTDPQEELRSLVPSLGNHHLLSNGTVMRTLSHNPTYLLKTQWNITPILIVPEEPGTPRLMSTEVFSTKQHRPAEDKDSLDLVMVKDEKEEELDQTTALARPDQFVMDETDGQLWTSVDPGRDADPDGHPDFSFHATEEYSQNISIFPSHSGLPSVPTMTNDVGPSLHSSIWKPHANMFSVAKHMTRHVRTLADETRQQMPEGESSERLNSNNEGNSSALQPRQHQYGASESTVRMSECMTGSNIATTSTFSGYSLSRSSFNMMASCSFQSQLVSIMEVLAKAAVAEINKRVDDSCAIIRLEMTQSQRDIDVLKRKCRMMESELKKTQGLDRRKVFYPMSTERLSYPVKIVLNKERSSSQWRGRDDSQCQPTDVEQRVETEPILIKDEETAEDVWKTDPQEELRVTGEESGSKPEQPLSFEQRHCNEDFITQPNISPEDSVKRYLNSDIPEEPGTPRLMSTEISEVFSTEQHRSAEDKDSLDLVMVKDEKEEALDQTTALAGPDQFVMDETDGQLWTSVDPGRDTDPDGHPDFSFHATEEYSQNISIFPSHSGLPSVPTMTDDVGPSLHSSIVKPHANMFSATAHMKRHVRTLADETRQQMPEGESSERLNSNNEGNSSALQPRQHQYGASESTVRLSECMTGSNMASTFSGYSLSRSSFNMRRR